MTDVSNASRTMLMNIDTLEWDPELLGAFGLDGAMMPAIK
jgi:glycerol kinase